MLQDIDIEWDEIVDSIKRKKCVLFLGPLAYFDSDGNTLEDASKKSFELFQQKYYEDYYEDGFFLFKDKRLQHKFVKKLIAFYEEHRISYSRIISKIIEIPFHLIFNLTPDSTLFNWFKEKNIEFNYDFYFKGQSPKVYSQSISKADIPFIYNMLGSFAEFESLVLTHDDFFDYIKSILNERSMPVALKEHLFSAEQYIFLGLPFDKWYMQILLRILSIHTNTLEHLDKISTQNTGEEKFRKIYNDQFKIEFIPTDMAMFVDKLHSLFQDIDALRKPNILDGSSIQQYSKKKIYDLISSNKTMDAMAALKAVHEQKKLLDETFNSLIIQMNNFQNLLQKENNNLISNTEAAIQRHNIINALLHIVQSMDEF